MYLDEISFHRADIDIVNRATFHQKLILVISLNYAREKPVIVSHHLYGRS